MKAIFALACLAGAAGSATAQHLTYVEAGLINTTQGRFLVDGKPLWLKPTDYRKLNLNSLFETTEGRAEILLSPGSYLRLADDSAVRLTYERYWKELRLEHVRGLTLIQCDKLSGKIIVTVKGSTISLLGRGIYEIGGDPAMVKVFAGKARVTRDGRAQTVKESTLLALEGAAAALTFDAGRGDSLYQWSRLRSLELAAVNRSVARATSGKYLGNDCWVWDPDSSMYTFLPRYGKTRNAFGGSYWSAESLSYSRRLNEYGDGAWDYTVRDGRVWPPASATAGRPR